jgi:hypothetical protein
LKQERNLGIFLLLWHWINDAQTGSIDELWTPDNPWTLKTPLGQRLSNARRFLKL